MVYDATNITVEYLPYTPIYQTRFKCIEIAFSYKHKTVARDAIQKCMFQLDEGVEAVFVKDGLITDTSIANIACKIDNQWLTPKKPLLQGTTRARLLDEKKLILADISVEDFKRATNIAFFNALTGFYELPIENENKGHPCY